MPQCITFLLPIFGCIASMLHTWVLSLVKWDNKTDFFIILRFTMKCVVCIILACKAKQIRITIKVTGDFCSIKKWKGKKVSLIKPLFSLQPLEQSKSKCGTTVSIIKQPKIPFTNLGSGIRVMLQASQSHSIYKAFYLSNCDFTCILLPDDIKEPYDIVPPTFIFLYDFLSKKHLPLGSWKDQPVLKNTF